MKTKFIAILITVAAICVSRAQTAPSTAKISDRVAYEIGAASAENRETPRSTATLNQQDDELQAEKEQLAMLRLKYTETHPEVVAAKNRIAQLDGSSAYQKFSSSGGGSVGRFGQRLQAVVRRGDSALPGSIIVTSAMRSEERRVGK